ncbi:hypothetical protein DNU06_16440 [Putridiphycobacter roseus]|uniref:histidine kinase n=1 Tax=Putridiphycobacter roseus TaxID=2219161 RepID=A0A2W1MWK0_9FLAO|nr:sensor histidine kinase [Putridiphycobacter roseus]PZE15764.1 hypothetical protein DNU06_16440 [Putridiphycobacter roseus]
MTTEQNVGELKRLKLTENVYFIAIICFLLIVFSAYFDQKMYFIQALGSLFIATICYTIVKKTKNYKLAVFTNIGYAVIIHIIGFISGTYIGNHGGMFWIINITLFAFYTVGKRGALFYLVFNIMSLISLKILITLQIAPPMNDLFLSPDFPAVKYVLNLLACTIIFIFMINKILKDFEQSQNALIQSNNSLKINTLEKTTMIKEIHHRVKNNLQVIISLLRLQLYKIDKEDALTAPFKDSIYRISTMALIHEELYRGDKVNDLDLQFYLENLCADLISSYATNCAVSTQIQTEINRLHMDDMVPLSLIMNELITNSIKHGFIHKKEGSITIQILKQENGITFKYQDTGTWIPPSKPNSFGIELIETLIEHFDGSYEIDTAHGTTFTFKLKLNHLYNNQ